MSGTTRVVLAPVLLAAALISFAANRDQATKRSWNELAREVQSYWTLRIVLADGTIVQGRRVQFITEGLTMQVENSTRTALYPKGVIFIPREQVKLLDIRTNRPVGRAVDRRFEHVQLVP